MKELHEIVNAYDHSKKEGIECVLATVIQVEGSSYRRAGARMLVLSTGLMIGAISGGCLEGNALQKALLTLTDRENRLVTYDTTDEDDITVGVQLGCEGIIHVLFEYIDFQIDDNPIELIRRAITSRNKSVLITFFSLLNKRDKQAGTKYLLTEVEYANSPDFQRESNWEIFAQIIDPPICLVIIGAGNDAIPLAKMAEMLGWEVRVVDGRQTHATKDRFINACQIIISKPEKVLETLHIDQRTCFVLMTHNYQYDYQMLKALLPVETPYIGLLGPKKKFTRIIDDLKNEGISLQEEHLSKIYAPTGLDIGSETPEEIAISIIAEIQAVINNHVGGMLKYKATQIHHI